MESLVEVEDFPGRLLHVAALWDNAELLEDLLNGDELSCLDARDSWGRSALHAAATNADGKCLRILLQSGAKAESACGARGEGRTPLHVAAEHGHSDNVRLLVSHGASLLTRDSLGLTAMDLAEKGDHKECMQILREAADRQEEARQEMVRCLQDACVSGDLSSVRSLLSSLPDAVAIATTINFIGSGGSNTLLFKASEYGHREVVSFLLDNGADGRIHPVTKYSPLYIAAYNGHKDVVELLLARFPGLINTLTVERWSPLHACCINGHSAIFEFLLRFPFRKEQLKTFRDKSGQWEYDFAFDINLCDVTGQSPLYLACCVSNIKIVDLLLNLKVKGRKVVASTKSSKKGQSKDDQGEKVILTKRTGIQALISRLRGTSDADELGEDETWLNPVLVDSYCSNGTETALHNAVRRRENAIASRLLTAGANPNLSIYSSSAGGSSRDEDGGEERGQPGQASSSAASAAGSEQVPLEEFYFKGSTCLVEACKNRDMSMIDLLLRYSARDDDCKALAVSVRAGDEAVVSKLLGLKANQDLENGINKKGIAEFNHSLVKGFASVGSLAYSSIFPSTPVMVNWHNQGGCLSAVKEQYLVDAAVRLNPKLRLSPRFQFSAVHAITRLDLSSNDLVELPECVWYLQSLKVLNLAQNKLEYLPSSVHRKIGLSSLRSTRSSLYNCPMLEEIFLQDNRLETLPAALFALKSLVSLDVSNNKLQYLPFEMWLNPVLKELNLAFNLLAELPSSRGWKSGGGAGGDASQTSSLNQGSSLSDVSYDSDDVSVEAISELADSDDETSSSSRKGLDSEKARCLKRVPLKHESLWSASLDIVESSKLYSGYDDAAKVGSGGEKGEDSDSPKESALVSLNLAHNSFSVAPRCLACLAPNLARLNLSYNSIAKFGPVASYPLSLKHLDLGYNQISGWPGDSPSHAAGSMGSSDNLCYATEAMEALSIGETQVQQQQQQQAILENKKFTRIHKLSVSSKPNACAHRGHSRLDNLRTLIMSNNILSNINYYSADAAETGSRTSEDGGKDGASSTRSRILFPAVSMLDVSGNNIHSIPDNISDLTNLSVLNVSNNPRISDLPPQMGLLNKLWNLNTKGCNLQEPLLTMSQSKSYKTSDIIGYLRSILENSKPYARLKLMVVGIQGIGKTTLLELLRQEGGSFKRKSGGQEHWAKRMGNKNINMKTGRGVSISTVGVDIGDWTFEKKSADRGGQASLGPVVFRTWDFGGQTEYYSTHQYFLSRRSLYVVVWRITDGEKGVNEIQQWLINIQARAPNSPVIVVGTHLDVVKDEFPPSFSEYLQQRIREKFIHITDPEKCGLPKVLETIEVSCKSRHNMRLLANLLYDTAASLRSPGSKARLLEQKIPASYLALEDLVGGLAYDLKAKARDPVLSQEQYEETVTSELERRFSLRFRDAAELSQATKFLHENGVLLHYDDATLRDLYFLDPQWLCDILSHVVTIREINPFAKNGIMRLEDLRHVFKSSSAISVSAKSYIVNLLNKFEVALTWDSRTLLIPSLLPTEQQMRTSPAPDARVRIAVRTRGWGGFRGRQRQLAQTGMGGATQGTVSAAEKGPRSRSVPSRALAKDLKISKPIAIDVDGEKPSGKSRSGNGGGGGSEFEMTRRSEAEHCIHRLLLMSYFPSGFWSRLLTRVLADDSVVEIVRSYFIVPDEMCHDPVLARIFVEQKPEWVCWQTGLELRYMDSTLFSMKQVMSKVNAGCDYSAMKLLLNQEESWTEVDTKNCSVLEVTLPQDTVVIKRPVRGVAGAAAKSALDDEDPIGYQALVLDANPRSVCQLLALAVEHIDTLLEDWYPSLGTRFLHTSEGKMLVTRLVPCPRCLAAQQVRSEDARAWQQDWSFLPPGIPRPDQPPQQQQRNPPKEHLPVRVSQESATSDKDSGVGAESPRGSQQNSSRRFEPENPDVVEATEEEEKEGDESKVYSFLVEECILDAFRGRHPACPVHGDLVLGQVAPDTVFLDLEDRLRVASDAIKLGDLIGRGAFGFVYEAALRQSRGQQTHHLQQQQYQSLQHGQGGVSGSQQQRSVAVKMLQPIDPGPDVRASAAAAFKANQSKWDRDPLQYACKAYCSARQELNILIHLRHPHIVPLVGICCSNPLSIVLELAPMGALDRKLRHYRRSGDRLPAKSVQLVILQIARALEYLHQHHIIYRDLKSENVLVWRLPEPFSSSRQSSDVHMKLADYGISRSTLPTGAKGFGGTEGFMAPEIVRYNGEEEYTEKVDTFSFGMFIYELVSLRQPFAGQDAGGVKELVLEGGRPALSPSEAAACPTYVLDLMVTCWAQQPRARPSASQVVSVASAPEFARLVDVASLDYGTCSSCSAVPPSRSNPSVDLWMGVSSAFEDYPQLHILEAGTLGWQDHLILSGAHMESAADKSSSSSSSKDRPLISSTVDSGLGHSVTSMCLVNDLVWMGDHLGYIHAYSTQTYRKLFSYKMEPDEHEEASPVRWIHFLPELQRACVAMHNGRMFLCCADVVPTKEEGMEGTFLITELGSATCIHSVTSVLIRQGGSGSGGKIKSAEIWCGESHGAVSVFTLIDGVVTSQEVVNHNSPVVENLEVLQVIASPKDTSDAIWTFVYPGCHIFQWRTGEQGRREIRSRLDCSKLVPSSESLRTIAGIDEHFSPGRCQIACMTVQKGKLYAGTSWGCLIVADALTMRPVSVFRPYSEEIQAIIPLPAVSRAGVRAKPPAWKHTHKDKDAEADEELLLVTLGKGYRSLIGRFVGSSSGGGSSGGARARRRSAVVSGRSRDGDDGEGDEEEDGEYDKARTMTALVWRPDDWLAD